MGKDHHLLKKGHHLFIKDRHLFGERPHPFPKGQERPGRRGKGISHTYPENSVHTRTIHKTPTTEFCKTAATATTQPSETTMDRASQGVVAAPFFIQKKGLLPPLSPVFYPGTTVGGGRYRRRRRTKHREKETGTDRQKPETGPAERSLMKDKTLTAT